jgi:hypothetical protein
MINTINKPQYYIKQLQDTALPWSVHREAAKILASYGLKDPDSDVRAEVAESLATWGHEPEVIEGLLAALRAQDETYSVQMAAAKSLKEWGEQPEVIEGLLVALRNQDAFVREEAAKSLAAWGHKPGVIEGLLVALQDDRTFVRIAAAMSLKEWGNEPEVIPALLAALQDEDMWVRDAAATSLAAWADNEEILASIREVLEPICKKSAPITDESGVSWTFDQAWSAGATLDEINYGAVLQMTFPKNNQFIRRPLLFPIVLTLIDKVLPEQRDPKQEPPASNLPNTLTLYNVFTPNKNGSQVSTNDSSNILFDRVYGKLLERNL